MASEVSSGLMAPVVALLGEDLRLVSFRTPVVALRRRLLEEAVDEPDRADQSLALIRGSSLASPSPDRVGKLGGRRGSRRRRRAWLGRTAKTNSCGREAKP
jgi:hypothetical protein